LKDKKKMITKILKAEQTSSSHLDDNSAYW
jgi:hypothetical protein